MKRNIVMILGVALFSIVLIFSSNGVADAASFENGTYNVPFELKEAGNNNTSIADGYFSKPAKLIVKNGVNYIQITTTESDWVKSITGPKGTATVISESGNSRTVQFEAGDLSGPVNMKMHVVVPESVAGMKYDHNHSLRAVFNVSGVPTASSQKAENNSNQQSTTNQTTTNEASGSNTDGEQVDNPKTGDTTPIWLYVALLVGSVGIFTIYKTRTAKNS